MLHETSRCKYVLSVFENFILFILSYVLYIRAEKEYNNKHTRPRAACNHVKFKDLVLLKKLIFLELITQNLYRLNKTVLLKGKLR